MATMTTEAGVDFHTYVADNDDEPCAECGMLLDNEAHTCTECGEFFDYDQDPNAQDLCTACTDAAVAELVEVRFEGYAGSRLQPAEAAEFTIACPLVHGAHCDAYSWNTPEADGTFYLTCEGDSSHGTHEIQASIG